MSKTWLVIGIIITSLSLIAITIFSLSNFILKRIYKEEQKAKTAEEKAKDKTVKRVVKSVKFIIKQINKKLVQNYLAFYGIASLTLTSGIVLTTVSGVNVVKQQRAIEDTSEVSSEAPSSEDESSSEPSSETSSYTSSIVSSEDSSIEESSEESSNESSSSSSEEETSILIQYTVHFYADDMVNPYCEAFVVEGEKLEKPTDPDIAYKQFKYWTADLSSPVEFDFSTPITSDLNLYARLKNAHYVRYTIHPDLDDDIDYDVTVKVEDKTHAENVSLYIMEDETKVYIKWGTYTDYDPYTDSFAQYDFDGDSINEDIHLWGIREDW